MGFFDDLAMGTGLKDRDDDYYERTAQTLGRESQGGSAQREAQYRSSMGMNGGATIANQGLSKDGFADNYFQKGGLLGMAASGLRDAIGGKGGGKVENPAQVAQSSQSPMRPQMRPIDRISNWTGNEVGMGGGDLISNSQMNQEMYGYDYPSYAQTSSPAYSPNQGYDYPTEFPLGAEPESLLSLERPFGSRVVPFTTAGPSSQTSDYDIQRDMPAYPAQVDGVVGTDTMMGRQVNPIPQVDAAEFQRFRSKFENLLRRNRQWGFPDREADAFQALKASGSNY